LFGAYCS